MADLRFDVGDLVKHDIDQLRSGMPVLPGTENAIRTAYIEALEFAFDLRLRIAKRDLGRG